MSRSGLSVYVFGSSLTSGYWNGAATYYRGLYKNLHARGYRITFAEPDIYDRHAHRDLEPDFAHCPIYRGRAELGERLREAGAADLIVKHSGVGADDEFLEEAVLEAAAAGPARARVAYWDVDAPATLAALEARPQARLRQLLPQFDYVFTYGGGPAVSARFRALGARNCFPIYNGLDPDTHHPAPPEPDWRCDLAFLGHRLPDREQRVQRFFFEVAERRPHHRFLLAGEGWQGLKMPANVQRLGYVSPADHNRLNCSARLVLNVNRAAMAEAGFSPPTRIFEAAGAGAALITDAWDGIGLFFEPGREILVAGDGEQVAGHLTELGPDAAALLGRRMRARALADHTYARRAERLDRILHGETLPFEPVPARTAQPGLEPQDMGTVRGGMRP